MPRIWKERGSGSEVIPALLADLRKRLKRGAYQPLHACKVFYPKRSGIPRPYTLLTVDDQIVDQALVNIVAEQLFPHVKGAI